MMDLQNPKYDPNAFIDWLITDVYQVKNDSALSQAMGIAPPVLSKIRHRKLAVGCSMLVKIHEKSGMCTQDIKARMFRQQELAQAA